MKPPSGPKKQTQNKPNSNPICRMPKISVNPILTKDYERNDIFAIPENAVNASFVLPWGDSFSSKRRSGPRWSIDTMEKVPVELAVCCNLRHLPMVIAMDEHLKLDSLRPQIFTVPPGTFLRRAHARQDILFNYNPAVVIPLL